MRKDKHYLNNNNITKRTKMIFRLRRERSHQLIVPSLSINLLRKITILTLNMHSSKRLRSQIVLINFYNHLYRSPRTTSLRLTRIFANTTIRNLLLSAAFTPNLYVKNVVISLITETTITKSCF